MPSSPSGGRRVHVVSRDYLLAVVRETGVISRAELGRRTGMARVTVNGLVAELLAADLLAEGALSERSGRPGRPARVLTLGPAAGCVVAALVGGDNVRVAVADLSGEIVVEHAGPLGTADVMAGLDEVAALIRSALAEAGPLGHRVWSTVVGMSAPVTGAGGTIQPSSVLPGWGGVDAATELQARLGRRVTIRNDADLSLMGEVSHGAAATHGNVVYLRIASGIGCGLLLDGHVHRGATGAAGEIGHVQVDETGTLCRCGNRGCLETIASPREILGMLAETYGEPMTAERVIEIARTDATAQRVLADAGRMIGRVVADLANTINPSLVVLDGPLIEAHGPIVTGVRESVRRYAQPEVADGTEVRASALAGRAAILGAVTAALAATPAVRGSRLFDTSDSARGTRLFDTSDSARGTKLLDTSDSARGIKALDQAASVRDSEVLDVSASGRDSEGFAAAGRDSRSVGAGGSEVFGASASAGGGLSGAGASAEDRAGKPVTPGRREREVRRGMITEVLRGRGPTGRSDLVKLTRLPRAAVIELLAELERDGVVEPSAPAPGERRAGRPSPRFRLAAAPGLLMGIALDAEGIRTMIADGEGRPLYDERLPVPLGLGGRPHLRAAGEFARGLLIRNGHDLAELRDVAVAVPAPVNPATGRFGDRGVLPMFAGFSPGDVVAEGLGRPVRADNNADLAALAETRRGAAKGAREVLYLRADQFTGAGIIAGGRMHRGAIGYAGEVGHLNVREVGPFCVCGARGCLSVYLSPAYFAALLGPGPVHQPDEKHLLALAMGNHRPVQRALIDAGRLIGRSVASVCNVLNPAVVVVGGHFAAAGPFVVDGVREALLRHCSPSATAGLTVVPAGLGEDAEVLGAIDSLL